RSINRYQAYIVNKFPSIFTAHSHMASIKAFLNWTSSDDADHALPPIKLKSIKLPRLFRNVLTREEIQRLENAARLERDKVIIRTFADTGVRISELLGVTAEDTKENSGRYYLRVMGKGRKQRDIAIAPKLARRIRNLAAKGHSFLSTRRPYPPLKFRAV